MTRILGPSISRKRLKLETSNLASRLLRLAIGVLSKTRCSAIAERPRCRVRYSFRQK